MAADQIYKPQIVSGLLDYYGELLVTYEPGVTINERLSKLSEHLWKAYEEDNRVIHNEINNYHPKFLGKSWEEIKNSDFGKKDAYITIASQYGYSTWEEVPHDQIDIHFESAIDTLLRGDQNRLNEMFLQDPGLATKKSQYGHEASLIHYIGSNGFEFYRQVVPYNLPSLLEYLIKVGCDVKSKMKVYGGEFEMIELVTTSAHPKAAGLLPKVLEVYQSTI